MLSILISILISMPSILKACGTRVKMSKFSSSNFKSLIGQILLHFHSCLLLVESINQVICFVSRKWAQLLSKLCSLIQKLALILIHIELILSRFTWTIKCSAFMEKTVSDDFLKDYQTIHLLLLTTYLTISHLSLITLQSFIPILLSRTVEFYN